jgi:hypothetical protein
MSKSRRRFNDEVEELDDNSREQKRRREKKINSHNYSDFLDEDDGYDEGDPWGRTENDYELSDRR